MLASHVLCQNSWLGQFLQLAVSIASWYFWVLALFVSSKPGVPLHSWGRAEASCWQGEEEEGGSLLGGNDGCSMGALGFAVLGTGDELQIL